MIGYCFTNKAIAIKTITGCNMPEIYFKKSEAEFVKRNHKATYKGWKVTRVNLVIRHKSTGEKHIPFHGERINIQM